MDKNQLEDIFHSSYDVRRDDPDYTILERLITEEQIAAEQVNLAENPEVKRMLALNEREKELASLAFPGGVINHDALGKLYAVRDELRRFDVYLHGPSFHSHLGKFGWAYLTSQNKEVCNEIFCGGVRVDLIAGDGSIIIECGNTDGYYMLSHFLFGFDVRGRECAVNQFCVIPFSYETTPDMYSFHRGGRYDHEYMLQAYYLKGW